MGEGSPERLALNVAQMSEQELCQALKDARDAPQLVQIWDKNSRTNIEKPTSENGGISNHEFNTDIS